MKHKMIQYADDDTYSIKQLIWMRSPSLCIGLMLGIVLSFITSNFDEVLAKNIQLAFFMPFIVYMADSVGTQTQNIYVRDLKSGRANFKKYLVKEAFIGIIIGIAASMLVAIVTLAWLGSTKITLAVSLATFLAIMVAPLVALCVTELLELEHTDPAVGAGPIATVIQDSLSILIYGLVASAILL